ncbi:MAG TPA: MFS transporter [Acetobacteraceae bacterium]|nr:MFS transporter [Acetobacteraceae bacterium]
MVEIRKPVVPKSRRCMPGDYSNRNYNAGLPSAPVTAHPPSSPVRLVALASLVGTTIEWYDFFLYGTAAALVFNVLFFPTFSPLSGTLAAFGTYAVGFVARPVGGIVFGHYGDRLGRKSMLVLTLVIMGVATFCIALLPTYARIGPWAPVLLVVLRVAQGFGVGGEWGGAVLMAVEHAPPGQRGFYGSWPQIGVPAGLLLSTGVFAVFARMPQDQFLAWGWRIPFAASALLVGVGLLIRSRVLETPAFERRRGRSADPPVLDVIRQYPRAVLLAMGARFGENAVFYLYSVFVLVYCTQHVGMDRRIVLTGVMVAAAVELLCIPFFGWLSDRVGRCAVYLGGALFTVAYAYPFFLLLDTGSAPLVWLALVLASAGSHAPMYAPQAAFFSELFGTHVRYTGASLGSQLASVFAGGLSPFIATALLARYGRPALSLFMAAVALVSVVAVLAAAETAHGDLDET